MPPSPDHAAVVDAAITSRHSIRAYLETPVPRPVIEGILAVAARAPSGTNTQPWQVDVLTGAAKVELSRRVRAAFADPAQNHQYAEEYDYYPKQWCSPYIDRRRKVGWDLYGLLGIEKGDKPRMQAQHARNYDFFDAPVGLVFSIDRCMGRGSWLDYGMFVQNIMIAARARGLDTCAQAAFNPYHRLVAGYLGWPSERMLVCAMSLGYADTAAVENSLVTDREAVQTFTCWRE